MMEWKTALKRRLRQWSRVNFCSADSSRVRQALCFVSEVSSVSEVLFRYVYSSFRQNIP